LAQRNVTVFAAASLTDSLKSVAQAYKTRTGRSVTLSFGASSALARQIEQGAPADIFFSADTDWMDYLQRQNLIDPASRKTFLGNELVLIGGSGAKPLAIGPRFNLAGALGGGKLALADPASVPAGKYGKAALTALGVWAAVAPNVIPAENVRVALEYVARGEAPYGIVYATDARVAPSTRIVGVFPENTHPPIVYPVALTRNAASDARGFLAFLAGAEARAIFARAGFKPL
jgi:molybdate transport system substrate-binding protein